MQAVRHARDTWSRHAACCVQVLDRSGVSYTGDDGINLWVAVVNERAAMLTLAALGIGVAPGEPFMVGSLDPGEADGRAWVRVTVDPDPRRRPHRRRHRLSTASSVPPWR